MKFGLMEVGSTNTKAYIYDNGELIDLGFKHIAFKDNYGINNKILESDIESLYAFINEIKSKVNKIYAYGTSIFRKISEVEKNDFISRIKNELDVDFKVVTPDEENNYTVMGALNNDYNGKLAIAIGGGGSTEIAIVENKRILQMINLDFGAIDINTEYPDLKDDVVHTSFDMILNYTLDLVGDLNNTVDVLAIAGGDHIHFYEKANYPMQKNHLYDDINQPYLLDYETANQYDKDILIKSLDKIKSENLSDAGWWNGVRGMRFCMNAVANKLNVKYIIPTRINMLIGLANEIVANQGDNNE